LLDVFFSENCINVNWFLLQVQTFPVDEPVHSADDLVDGVALAQILHQM